MDLKINSKTTFGCKLSTNLEKKMYRQVKVTDSKRKINKLLSDKLDSITKWGNEDTEIVYARHPHTGHIRLGLKADCGNGIMVRFPITGLAGRNELSQFLALTEKKILATETSIKSFYKKYGLDFFKRFMTTQ